MASVLTLAEHLKRSVGVVLAHPAGAATNRAKLFHGLILAHHEALALLIAEIKRRDGSGFRCLSVPCSTVPSCWARFRRIETRQDRILAAFRADAIFLLGGMANK